MQDFDETQLPMLAQEDSKRLLDLKEELAEAWDKQQVFRTETEMRVSVLSDMRHPTPASKYWQCIREQTGMLESVYSLGFGYRRNEIRIRQKKKEIDECRDPLQLEELQIDLEELLWGKAKMEKEGAHRVREIELWSQLKQELNDGSFDTRDVNAHQQESLHQRFINQASTITPGTAQSEAQNIIGLLKTSKRLKAEKEAELLEEEKRLRIEEGG